MDLFLLSMKNVENFLRCLVNGWDGRRLASTDHADQWNKDEEEEEEEFSTAFSSFCSTTSSSKHPSSSSSNRALDRRC